MNRSGLRAFGAALLSAACGLGSAAAHAGALRCERNDKLYQGTVTTSVPPYGGHPHQVTDCRAGRFVNLPDFTGSFTVTTAADQCYSKFAGTPSMLPDGPVSLDIILFDATGVELGRKNFNRQFGNDVTSYFPLDQTQCGVRSVTFQTLSSPSWVAWYELVGD